MNLRELTWIALFAVAANPTQAQETIPVARIDSVFTEHNRSDRPGCTLAVFKNGEIAARCSIRSLRVARRRELAQIASIPHASMA